MSSVTPSIANISTTDDDHDHDKCNNINYHANENDKNSNDQVEYFEIEGWQS